MFTPVGLAHLTLLQLSPPELVSTAAAAGYDFVGVRVQAVTPGEHQYPMEPGSPMSRETLRRLDDTGLELLDAVPAGTPVSVEVPHARLQASLTLEQSAQLNLRAVRALLRRMADAQAVAHG